MTSAQPTLHTERLILRPLVAADAPLVQRLAGARAVADTTLAIPHPYPDGAAETWIQGHAPAFAAGTRASFAIVHRADDFLIGVMGLVIDPGHLRAELGYWIGEGYWGRGYATEGGRAILDCGFASLKLHRIHAQHMVRNPASGRVLQKLGMRFEGIHRHAVRKWGVFEDLAQYAALVTEWPPAG